MTSSITPWPADVDADAFRGAVAMARAALAGDGARIDELWSTALDQDATIVALALLPGALADLLGGALGVVVDVDAALARLALVAASLDVLPDDDG
ncbi:MAG: hypothetical protein M5U14_09400 [Acidimicrobiia bacterium]|nr:hypothetical protein [Acidimicrobiia bacterium]